MTGTQHDSNMRDLPTPEAWSQCEERIEAFEQAWQVGPPPNIDDFLRGEESEQMVLLVELIHADLEFRLKAGETARVESYFDRYPRTVHARTVVLDLLQTEFALRKRRGEVVGLDEYSRRFPAYVEDLRRHLDRSVTLADGSAHLNLADRGTELPVVPGYDIIEELGRG